MARRVFQLAKELGVKSTAVVAKCQAEGLDIKNHMSTLSAGLEATIREWFSTGENATTVETAAPVDLEKVKNTKARKKKEGEHGTVEVHEDFVAVAEMDVDEAVETETEAAEPAACAVSIEEIKSGEHEKAEDEQAELVTRSDEDDTLAAATAISQETKPAQSPHLHLDEKSGRPRRMSPKELHEHEEQREHVTTEVVEEEKTTEAAPQEKAAAHQLETETIEARSDTPEPPQQVGPRIIARELPKPPEPSKEPPKPAEFVPAPAVLQGPKVIRTEAAETTLQPPSSRGNRRGALNTRPEISDAKKAAPAPDDPAGSKRRRKDKQVAGATDTEDASKKKTSRSQRRRGSSRRYETTEPDTQEWRNRDLLERQQRLDQASGSKLHRKEQQLARHEYASTGGYAFRTKIDKAVVKEPITIKELSSAIGIRANEIIAKLMAMGTMANINQALETNAAMAVALEFGIELEVEEKTLLWDDLAGEFEKEADETRLQKRPPIVAFLGHVDHGKTSLLDRIRQADVTAGEAGGITQHIGSYLFDDGSRRVAFLDTPGHKAFTEMRSRGATMTDVLVLVVAVDDGVMPQTEEAINHAKAANVPIIVALNKMDLPNADENRVLGQLADKGLLPTEWGGDVEVVRTSAATGMGVDDLLEYLDYVAELNNLQAVDEGPATGWVVESEMTSYQGAVARMLVKGGKLKAGDIIVSRCAYGRIRTMYDATGKTITEAGPSTPVEVTGLDEIPVAGDRFYVVDNITRAAQIAGEQRTQKREKKLAQRRQITLDNLFTEIAAGALKELNVIVKADVQGSVDVLCNTIQEMNTKEVAVKILHAAVGGVTESDVLLAQASNAIIIGFQVVADDRARSLAEREGVEIRLYRVIYQISDDIKKALEGMLEPYIEEKPLGRVEVRQLFRISRLGVIAGCYVTEGVVNRSARFRVIRDNVVIRDNSPLQSLRRGKDDSSEVRHGYECGIKLVGFDAIKEGDILEAYELVEVNRTLDSVK